MMKLSDQNKRDQKDDDRVGLLFIPVLAVAHGQAGEDGRGGRDQQNNQG